MAQRKKRTNHGAVKLRAYLRKTYGDVSGRTIETFALRIGCSIYAGRKWLTGERHPRPEHQIQIQRLTTNIVSPNDWALELYE